PDTVDLDIFRKNIENATGGRVEIDTERRIIRARGALSEYDKKALLLAMPDVAAPIVEALVHKSRGARLRSTKEETATIRFAIPRLGVQTAHGLQL
ncbi:hypothetical protein HBA94_17280, partial [Ochrobactrum sp. GRS2]|nr:hypothetical protein [Ochrobactrum sp. GRS2]